MNALRESKELTKKAKQIFGDVVENAYFSQYIWSNKEWCSEQDFNNEFKSMEKSLNEKSEIGIDGIEVVIPRIN